MPKEAKPKRSAHDYLEGDNLDDDGDLLARIPPPWVPRTDYRMIERRIGYRFPDPTLLVRALTPHAKRPCDTYQKLEFFGDGVLRYIIPHLLQERYPAAEQGELSRMYSSVTCNTNLALMSYRLRIPYYILFGSRPYLNRKLLADIVEAIIGAVDETGGLGAVEAVCRRIFRLDIELSRFYEPQDTLLRLLQREEAIESIIENAPEGSPLKTLKRNPKVSYQAHVIHKRWGKLGHVSVLRVDGNIIVRNGEGYDAESSNSNAAAMALLRLFPKRYPSPLTRFTWRINT